VEGSPDVAALVWDLTVHRLHRAFATCPAKRPDGTHGGPIPLSASTSPAETGRDGVRLAATRHAVNDVRDALRRMAAGSYGTCQRCARPIGAQRLQAAPTQIAASPRLAALCGAGLAATAARRHDPMQLLRNSLEEQFQRHTDHLAQLTVCSRRPNRRRVAVGRRSTRSQIAAHARRMRVDDGEVVFDGARR